MILLINMVIAVDPWNKFETTCKFISNLSQKIYLSSSQDLSQCLLVIHSVSKLLKGLEHCFSFIW